MSFCYPFAIVCYPFAILLRSHPNTILLLSVLAFHLRSTFSSPTGWLDDKITYSITLPSSGCRLIGIPSFYRSNTIWLYIYLYLYIFRGSWKKKILLIFWIKQIIKFMFVHICISFCILTPTIQTIQTSQNILTNFPTR